jgi:transcriptional regulator GlxA family with amidase domain
MTRSVGIYLFDNIEILDFAGPYEVFSTASRVKLRLESNKAEPFRVFTVADTIRTVRARGGLMVQPQFNLANHPAIDVLIIPGGIITAELQKEQVVDWIRRTAHVSEITASVCTGAFLLGRAGLLHGKNATTHWEDITDLKDMFPDINVQPETRRVDAGKIITSAGISAGIDMSLHLVARLEGEELAIKTARQMEFDWQRPSLSTAAHPTST